ncbi:TRL-like family protein [Sanyastnella coralliicola]|uniref:TRL-like family protein n=1 Tax=Sanyastnella coralliicola TaxID=3069118 RepID=UPI0027BA4F2B|nr:TRL-like family protein [Longitalea sp. SCSIO 12813]
MKKVLFGLAGVAMIALSSCSITLPVTATSNAVGNKVGKSSGTCYLGVLCFGVDASIQTAAKNGGISKISTVDYTQKNVLNLIITHETTVTGE